MKNSISEKLFKSLRGKLFTKSDVYMKLKQMSKDLDESYYIFLLEDLIYYLDKEKIVKYSSYSNQQIIDEMVELESKGSPIPKFGRMTNVKGSYPPNVLNLEPMFYPNEFQSLYILQDILNEKIIVNNSTPKETELLNIIDFGESKGTEKIIMLYLLGILDELRKVSPFNTSTNLLATVISSITNEKVETIQSYLNPIFSAGVSQKNNPLMNIEKVDIVRQKLISLGFKPIK